MKAHYLLVLAAELGKEGKAVEAVKELELDLDNYDNDTVDGLILQ